ncbi:hypothetical protein E2C01_080724 [Portunus trituberculatus]|uniref:Uncharacterized protein n=1 Tax=Portunus trituberculatus TaxID=210409 RepID=A0A5B7IUS6_PORTR|nr:hypothetical protein [Portunus trituberculatus]
MPRLQIASLLNTWLLTSTFKKKSGVADTCTSPRLPPSPHPPHPLLVLTTASGHGPSKRIISQKSEGFSPSLLCFTRMNRIF